MVLLLTVGVIEEERSEERLLVPVETSDESVQEDILLVLQLMAAVFPFKTREGLAVKLLITPWRTQVEPPATCTCPEGQVQLGEYASLRPLAQMGNATQVEAPKGWY